MSCEPIFFFAIILMWYTRNIFLFFLINWTLRMSDNLPERVQILGHVHILCITVRDNIIICCQIFCDLLLKSAFEQIFNVMQLISVKITWHIKWKYLIQKFHDIYLSYYFKTKYWKWWFGLWCLHATFNNISAISWQSVLLVEETGGGNRSTRRKPPVASHLQTLSHNVASRMPRLGGIWTHVSDDKYWLHKWFVNPTTIWSRPRWPL
jgi:hypothetical protein